METLTLTLFAISAVCVIINIALDLIPNWDFESKFLNNLYNGSLFIGITSFVIGIAVGFIGTIL